ncbi:VWA domain-containing protein (plasmid) [Deinococcus radiomollis]|uniref:VWA domain-containing protein n=1 Tax=Deinococcus radiomollis TaxID=468916 RepID=UPI00389269E5
MHILQTGQRLSLPSPQLQLQLSGEAGSGLLIACDAQARPLMLELAQRPAGQLAHLQQVGQLTLDLASLPATVQTVAVLYGPGGQASEVLLNSGSEQYGYEGPVGDTYTRLMEFYRRDGGWRLYAAGEAVGTLQQVHASLPEMLRQAAQLTEQSAPPSPAAQPSQSQSLNTARPAPASGPSTPLSLSKQATQAKLLSLAKDQAPAMVPVIEQARLTLQKAGLDTLTFEVVLVLDVSASMTPLFKSGQVQRLVERALAVAARLDDNGEVPVTLFGTHARSGGTVDLSNISGYIRSMRFSYDGGTVYAPAIREVVKNASNASWPTLVLFVTDGENSDHREAEVSMTAASSEAVFFKFLALGDGPFRFLEKLDTMPGRVVDNANFAQIENLTRTDDAELFSLISQEIGDWIPAATKAGILNAEGRPNRGARPGPPRPTPPRSADPADNRPWWKKLLD